MPPSPSIGKSSASSINPSDETTPLLSYVEPAPIPESHDPDDNSSNVQDGNQRGVDEDEDRPLPKAQVFLLCYSSCVAPTAFFSIFPYINFMIEKVGGVATEDVGFYSGLIESLFSATQMCVMILWGKVCVWVVLLEKEKERERENGC